MKKKRLSVFIDESGDLGEYNKVTEFYVVSFVFHDQSNNISGQIGKLDNALKKFSNKPFAIHTQPLIRREEMFKDMSAEERRTLFTKLFFFTESTNILYKTFIFNKKYFKTPDSLINHITRGIFDYFTSMTDYFKKYDEVVVYYDNGQLPIKYTIQTLFSLLFENFEMRKVLPIDYRLFQSADMLCTLYLINEKFQNHPISKSEKYIFSSKRDFYRQFFNSITELELKKK